MHTIHPSRKALKNILQDLTTAIFKTDINSNLWLPNNIISVLYYDSEGHVYFNTTCQKNRVAFLDKFMHCTLEFNQKDYTSALKLTGVAEIVENDSNLNTTNESCLLTLKMSIQTATYSSEKISILNSLKDKFSTFRSHLFSSEKFNEISFN